MQFIQRLLFFLQQKWQKKATIEEIPFSKIDHWIQTLTYDVMVRAKIEDELVNYVNLLKDKRWLFQSRVREFSLIVGHKAQRLISILQFSEKPGLDEVLILNNRLQTEIASLIPHLARQEDEQFESLQKHLTQLASALHSFEQKVEKAGLLLIKTLSERKQKIEGLLAARQENEQEILSRQERLVELHRKLAAKLDELQRLHADSQYADVDKIRKQRAVFKSQLREIENLFNSSFTKLLPAIEKYNELSHNPLLVQYCKNPHQALCQDENLGIAHILQHLAATLQSGSIMVTVEEYTTITATLAELTMTHLAQIQKQFASLTVAFRELTYTGSQEAIALKSEDITYRIDHFQHQVDYLQQEITELQELNYGLQQSITREKELFDTIVGQNFKKPISVDTSS